MSRYLALLGACMVMGIFAGVADGQTRAKAPTPVAKSSGLLFNGSTLAAWPLNQSCSANSVQQVSDPDGQGDQVLKFTVLDTDVYPCTPTSNPRAQLVSPSNIYKQGQAYWVSYGIYLPSNFPVATSWVQLGEPIYGPPFNGSPSIALDDNSNLFQWQAGPYENYEVLWSSPVVRGQWVQITWHFDVSTSGYCDLYVNNSEVAAVNPFSVLDGANGTGPWTANLNVYYQEGEFSSATAYYRNYKIGTTEASVN